MAEGRLQAEAAQHLSRGTGDQGETGRLPRPRDQARGAGDCRGTGDTLQVDSVLNPTVWPGNIMTDLDRKHAAAPEQKVNGRSLIMTVARSSSSAEPRSMPRLGIWVANGITLRI